MVSVTVSLSGGQARWRRGKAFSAGPGVGLAWAETLQRDCEGGAFPRARRGSGLLLAPGTSCCQGTGNRRLVDFPIPCNYLQIEVSVTTGFGFFKWADSLFLVRLGGRGGPGPLHWTRHSRMWRWGLVGREPAPSPLWTWAVLSAMASQSSWTSGHGPLVWGPLWQVVCVGAF